MLNVCLSPFYLRNAIYRLRTSIFWCTNCSTWTLFWSRLLWMSFQIWKHSTPGCRDWTRLRPTWSRTNLSPVLSTVLWRRLATTNWPYHYFSHRITVLRFINLHWFHPGQLLYNKTYYPLHLSTHSIRLIPAIFLAAPPIHFCTALLHESATSSLSIVLLIASLPFHRLR